MSAVRAFFLGLREVFTLSHAEARAREVDEAERARRERHIDAAIERRRAAKKIATPIAAIVLLRDALRFALGARGVDLADSGAPAADIERVKAALASDDAPFALDDLPFAEAESLRASFEACVDAAIGTSRTRTLLAVRALRVTRIVAVLVFLAWLIVPYARQHWMLHDVALGKVVTSSPLRGESPPAEKVVDGKTRGTFDIATIEIDHAFVMVDLEKSYAIDRVRVVNRGDGWFDDILPVILEVSEDGARFDAIARKDDHFDTWTIPLGGRSARFVRLIKPDRGYIAINELEVYAR